MMVISMMFCPSSLPNTYPIYYFHDAKKKPYYRILLTVLILVCSAYVVLLTILSTRTEVVETGWTLRRHSYNVRNLPQKEDNEMSLHYHEGNNDMNDSRSRRLNYFDPYNDPKSITMKEDPTSRQNQDVQLQQPFLQQPRASIYKNPTDSEVTKTEGATTVEESQNLQVTNNNYNDNAPQATLSGQEVLQQQPLILPQPRASIYKIPITDSVTQIQEPAQQYQIASPTKELLRPSETAPGPNDSSQALSLEIPQHLQQQQQQQTTQKPIELLGSAATGTTGNGPAGMQYIKELPVMYQTPLQEMGGTDNQAIEIPQHLLPSQQQNTPKRQHEIETNFDTQILGQETVKSWETQGLQQGVEEIPMDELTRRWGEPTAEELEEKELVLPNQEQKCPLSKFNPEDHKFDITPKNLSIAEKLQLSGYKDVWDWKMQETDLPVFWHIPKSGGSTVKDIMGSCHRFVMASEAGIRAGHDNDTQLAIVKVVGDERNRDGSTPFINVDTTTVEGLHRAKRLGLAQCGLARAIVIRHVFESDILFDSKHKGRLFAVFRHPVDRQVSLFNYLKIATWEPTYIPEFANMTLKEYVRSPYVEYNWLTRYLSGDKEGTLTQEHMRVAMDVVRRKFLVGLLSRKEETMERFEQYFEWTYRVNPKNQEICRDKLLKGGANINTNKGEKAKPNTPVYETLLQLNKYDIQLYNYIESLFDEQADFVKDKKAGFRLEGATCCKCHRYPQC